MRILYVINGFDPGGAEHGLLTLIKAGCFDAHDLRILAFCRGRGSLADQVVAALGAGRVSFVTTSEKLTLWACLGGFCRLLALAFRLRPHKVVLSLKQANVVGRFAAIFLPRVSCVAFEHIAEYRARNFSNLYGPLLRLLSWRVDEIWADCVETLVQTHTYFFPKARLEHVIPLFVADEKAPCKANYDTGTPFRIVSAGRLVRRKNVAQIVDVVAALRATGINVTLDVFGDGPEYQAVSQMVLKHGLAGNVALHGYRNDWIAQATEADLLLNLSDMEGFCIVVAEAMNAGLPVIAVEVGGIRDYGRDGENMIKLAAADPNTTKAAVLQLLQDRLLRERLGRQARADMLGSYNVECLKRTVTDALDGRIMRVR